MLCFTFSFIKLKDKLGLIFTFLPLIAILTDIIQERFVGGSGNMGPPQRERYKVTKKQKTGVRLKRGSKKFQHLQKFIERRREKKLEKRRTFDSTAKVILLLFLLCCL